MIQPTQPTGLRTFLIIWLGQTASLLGSRMTTFAITIWAWEQTEQATPLSLIIFFTEVPALIAAFFGGVLVDRFNRKQLMILGDGVAAFSTVAILLLLVSDSPSELGQRLVNLAFLPHWSHQWAVWFPAMVSILCLHVSDCAKTTLHASQCNGIAARVRL